MGTNERARLSMARMKVDEGFCESRTDLNINGTSVVPYTLWNENTTKVNQTKTKRMGGFSRKRVYGFGPTTPRPHG